MINLEKPSIPRSMYPHHATITMKIDIRKIEPDGKLDTQVIGDSALEKYGISRKAQICFSAPTEADCIKLVKDKLENM